MKITFLGVGSAFSKLYGTSAALVESGSVKLLLDCGQPIPAVLDEKMCGFKNVTHIFISHLHADHIAGLEQVAIMMRMVYKKKIKILSTASILERLWNCSLRGGLEFLEATPNDAQAQTLEDYFTPMPIDKHQWVAISPEESPLLLKLHTNNHVLNLETYGIELANGSLEKEKRFLYSGDVRFTPEYIRYGFENCSLIFHDCQLFDSGENNSLGVHASYNQLLSLPPEIRHKIWIYHYGDSQLPDAESDGFSGFVQPMQAFFCEN